MNPTTFKPLLDKLVKTPEYFGPEDAKLALEHVFTPGAAGLEQIGSFLTALHLYRIERRPEILTAAVEVLRHRGIKADVEDWNSDFVVDIVGTGGDGHDTFNVSTTAAVVAAGAGARVIKHGSKASTSSSGSADLLQSLGCLFTPPAPDVAVPLVKQPFTFILAPHFHPAMAYIAPIRKALPFRTMFNILGPLINPAHPRGMVLGVADRALGATFASSLRDAAVEHALVVYGAEGLDEISCAGDTHAWELKDGKITERTLHPDQFGLPTHPLKDVAGGTPSENAETFKTLLTSGANIPSQLTPILDFVLLNAAALLYISGKAPDLKTGTELAREAVESGKAWDALCEFRKQGEALAAAAA